MNKVIQRANFIQEQLDILYPRPPIPLNHNSPYTLLIAVILSAQSTDKKVNELTKELFKAADNPFKMYELGESNIYKYINQIGLANQKARYIYKTSKIIIDKFSGKVPVSFSELELLPGVGHKTASVVMAQSFGVPSFPVDTHIHRLAQRWGLSKGNNVKETENALKDIFPKNRWNKLHLQMIYYGREYCSARGCDGTKCKICSKLYPNRKSPYIHKKA